MQKRIYYHDTDCGGVVYYANYLKYLEEARTEYFEEKGILIKDLSQEGVLFVVARQEIDYKAPARYGDLLQVTAKIIRIGAVKIEFEQEARNQAGEVICLAKTVMVCINRDFKPQEIPEDVRNKLS